MIFSGTGEATKEDDNATFEELGGGEISKRDWVVAAAMFVEMRQLYAV